MGEGLCGTLLIRVLLMEPILLIGLTGIAAGCVAGMSKILRLARDESKKRKRNKRVTRWVRLQMQ